MPRSDSSICAVRGARLLPFALERGFLFFEAQLFLAKIFGLLRELLAGRFELGAFFEQGSVLLSQRSHALAGLRDFIGEARFEGFGAREALGHRGQLFAARDHLFLQPLKIMAQIGDGFGGLRRFGFRCLAGTKRFGMLAGGLARLARGRLRRRARSRAISSRSAASCWSTRCNSLRA